MRISDWSSDVCSSDLGACVPRDRVRHRRAPGARWFRRPVAVHRLRRAAGPDGHAQQEVRRRGSGKYTYAVQGLGHVGMEDVKLLQERGAKKNGKAWGRGRGCKYGEMKGGGG